MQFSPEQQAAITAGNRELLVSAAAGSGKTAVLIEKIYTMLKQDGLQLDRMLVVTFTRAAAAEMRDRLKQRMAGDSDPHIRRQRDRLELAHISTLHSFCHSLVQEYFQVADIDPLSTIADTTTASNLFQEALDTAMEQLYERADAGDTAAISLTDKFEDKKIVAMARELYPFLMTLANPFGWLHAHAAKHYTLADLETGAMAETLLTDCRVLLDGAHGLTDELRALADNPYCHEKYKPSIQADCTAVDTLIAALSGGLTAVVAAASCFSLDRMPGVRGLSDTEKEINLRYKVLREGLKKLAAKVGKLFTQPPETIIARLNAMQPALLGLHDLCLTLHHAYLESKKQRSVLDPNDLEHMALQILENAEIRAAVSVRFDAVFVDEYQDISGVQEALLNAVKQDTSPPAGVSRETIPVTTDTLPQRFFYVGDVKQSIYRFRQADPTLFMHKEVTFSEAADAPQRRIDLNRNYRSRGAVLDAVNRVFEQIMRRDVTEIAYDSRARLYAGQSTEVDPPVQLHVFTTPLKSADYARVQAAAIAREIKARVGQPFLDRKENRIRTLRYRDIAILAPRMKGVDDVLTRVLGAENIPVYAEGSGLGLQSEEIAQVLCHLKLMDNIQDDLSLLACLRSPAIGLTDAELAEIRIRSPKGSYLEAVRLAATGSDPLAERCARAMAELEHERFLLRNTPLPDYLWKWLSRSGLYAFYGCQPFGRLRQANLRLLCEKAVEFQSRGSGDLRTFLQSVVSVTAARESVSPTVLSPREDVVRVMSIHKSKGLEFPVVFLMGLEAGFLHRGGSDMLAHQRLGVALPYIDEIRRVKGGTLLSSAIALRQKSENLAERARVLYVGMTRARDELILMGCMATPPFSAARPTAYSVASAAHMLDWLMQCTDPELDSPCYTEDKLSTQSTSFPHKQGGFALVFHNSDAETMDFLQQTQPQSDRESLDQQRSRLEIITAEARALTRKIHINPDDASDPVAPRLRRDHHPFKVGVTALVRARRKQTAESPALFDPDADDPAEMETVRLKRLPLPLTRPRQIADLPALPAFMRETDAVFGGVQRGVATHKALSLLQYDLLRRHRESLQALRLNIRTQLQGFLQKRLFTQEEFQQIDIGSLATFFCSPWGRDALDAETVKREWGFVLRLPEEDGLLVQGVIDLCYLKDGQWELLDYKTDAVEAASQLWSLYEAQTDLYRRALEDITGTPVRGVTLYALSAGQGDTRMKS